MALDTRASFVDGYPSDPSQPDYEIQVVIDGELRNCQALYGAHVTNGLLYPAYFAARREVHAQWLEPALRRFASVVGRAPWDHHLRRFLQLLLSSTSPSSDAVLLLMAKLGPHLQSLSADSCDVANVVAAALRKRKKPLTAEWMEVLDPLVGHLIGVHAHGDATFEIAWRLWRAPENPHDVAPCYSARVRSDLRAMSKEEAAAWSGFLDLRGLDPVRRNLEKPYVDSMREVVARIGKVQFASRWKTWIGEMADHQPAALSGAGRDLLLLFLHACGSDTALEVDETLYELCGVRWAGIDHRRLTPEWLGALLVTLATRPAHRAFACAEQLIHNPDTNLFADCHKLYEQLLAEAGGEADQPVQREGVDGYDLMCQPALYRHQLILDRFLRGSVPGAPLPSGAFQPTQHAEQMLPFLIRRQSEADHAGFVQAVNSRMKWVNRVQKPPEVVARRETPLGEVEIRGMNPSMYWKMGLIQLQHSLVKATPELGYEDLLTAMDSDIASGSGMAGETLLSRITDYVGKHGYSVPLVKAIEKWHAAQHGSHSALAMRHRIGWLLWLDDVAPIDDKDCWSQRIRRDLRKMDPAARKAWLAIIQTNTTAKIAKPPKAWTKQAKGVLLGVPADEFCRRVRGWLEPLRAPEALHLTVCGRDVLRTLMYCAVMVNDPHVDEAIAWFASANWRTKRDRLCAETLLPSFFYALEERSEELAYTAFETLHHQHQVEFHGKLLKTYQGLAAKLGRPASIEAPPQAAPAASQPPNPAAMVVAMLKRSGSDSKVSIENGRLIINGVRHNYEIDMENAKMVRLSDGRPVRLEFDISSPAFAMLRSMMDSGDMNNPFQPNPMRVAICARFLLRDDINAPLIVADED